MTDSGKNARKIFSDACDLPESKRPEYVKKQCGDDSKLFKDVMSLLYFHDTHSVDSSENISEPGEYQKSSETNNSSSGSIRPPGSASSSSKSGNVNISLHFDKRLTEGSLINERYQLLHKLGEGGMGRVFLAKDTLLDETIAIKFLTAVNQKTIDRLQKEVKLARKISHSAVCRVFDMGRCFDLHYVTMEYIQGDTLATILQQVGRLSPQRVHEITVQLIMGLAAAHGKGVLHRDIKPANIMIDPKGQVKLTDFGIAMSMDSQQDSRDLIGTPAYMAPEQLMTGGSASEQSDIYSLGLVLYEAITGERVHKSKSLIDLLARDYNKRPEKPSSIVPDVDEHLDELIISCLEPDPTKRPVSALAMSTRLPDLDTLWVAKQAGVTPPPELLAAQRIESSVPGWKRWTTLSGLVVLLLLFAGCMEWTSRQFQIGHISDPALLKAKAETILKAITKEKKATFDYGYLDNAFDDDMERNPLFWYRQPHEIHVPDTIVTLLHETYYYITEKTLLDESSIGRDLFLLSMDGDLVLYQNASRYLRDPDPEYQLQSESDWSFLFEFAGLIPESIEQRPKPEAEIFAEEVVAWNARDASGDNVSVTAGVLNQHLVYFEVVGVNEEPLLENLDSENQKPNPEHTRDLILFFIYAPIIVCLVVLSIWLAVRNIRRGRADQSGAIKLFVLVIAITLMEMVLLLGHVSHPLDFRSNFTLNHLLIIPMIIVLCYLAMEPFARRTIPRVLVTWNLVLRSKFKHPDVGRSLIAGAILGTLYSLVEVMDAAITLGQGKVPDDFMYIGQGLNSMIKIRYALAAIIHDVPEAIFYTITAFFLYTMLVSLINKPRIHNALFFVLFSLLWGSLIYQSWTSLLFYGPSIALITLVLLNHFDLLTGIIAVSISHLLIAFPVTFQIQKWYAGTSWLGICTVVAVALYGFKLQGTQSTEKSLRK